MAEQDVVLGDVLISRMAREVARNLVPITRIKTIYKLTQDQFDQVVSTPFFQMRLLEEQAIWNASDANSGVKRISAKSATMVEESLPELYRLIHDQLQPMTAKIDALKNLARWAGIGENANVKGSADDAKVRITINVGGQKMEFDKEKVLQPPVIDAEVVDLTPNNS